jgi:hypothetical protein
VFLCCVFGLYVVCLVSSIACFCVLFLAYPLCVLYPVLRVSVLCFWFMRNTGYKTHNVYTKNKTQKHAILDTRHTTYKLKTQHPVLRVSVLCFWFIRCLSCIQYYVFLCCVFGLCVVCLVSSIACFCVVFTRNTGYKTHNV